MSISIQPGLEIEVEYPVNEVSIEAEIPPFISDTEVEAILVSGPAGEQGPEGPEGPEASLDVDPVLLFENALA